MSGFVGILHLDGSPVESELLRDLTGFLDFRGPDAQHIWLDGPIGLGAALLNSGTEKMAAALVSREGNLCIVADARVDGRRDLDAKLRARGLDISPAVGDAEVILHSYRVWGEQCLEHLIGDFSFAIWDGARRRLFCARDQMGVKPLFYAHLGPLLLFGNTLDGLRRHPSVSDRLDDLSIADFLVFDMIQNPAATAFADIQRLPSAHFLRCEQGRVSLQRYWTPPVPGPIQYRCTADYIDHFHELLDTAVADRLRTKSACIFMSGGLDSSTVAASAKRVAVRTGGATSVWAYTQVFDRLIPHEERHYASLVAQALELPIEYRADDDLRLFQFAQRPDYHSPEPVHTAWPDVLPDQLRHVAPTGRVVLTGFGADPLFSSRISVHFRQLLRHKRFGRALADAARYLTVEGRLSRLYLRTRWRILRTRKTAPLGLFPPWLNEDFVRTMRLRERWEAAVQQSPAPAGAVRPEAYEVTFAAFWPDLFNVLDPGVTGVPVEIRHPFFDLRLMNYLLALPRLPWCSDKQLLREAGRGVLPDAVCLRRKSPLLADPLRKLLEMPEAAEINRFEPVPGLERFVNTSRIPQVSEQEGLGDPWVHLRPLSLNYWLRGLSGSAINAKGGIKDELSIARRP